MILSLGFSDAGKGKISCFDLFWVFLNEIWHKEEV